MGWLQGLLCCDVCKMLTPLRNQYFLKNTYFIINYSYEENLSGRLHVEINFKGSSRLVPQKITSFWCLLYVQH